MIKNEHQYKITKKLIDELSESLVALQSNQGFKKLPSKAKSAHVSSLRAQLDQSTLEIEEYQKLKSGNFDFELEPTIQQIPSWLIKARIARGLNQEDLARLLKVKKQQIQHYESTDYASASLTRIREIADVLKSLNSEEHFRCKGATWPH